MNNKDYFEYSHKHEDEIIDFTKQVGVLVVNKNSSESETKLMLANHRLIEYITTYKTLKDDSKTKKETLDNIIDKIINLIENTELINYSAFCTYFQVIGYSYSSYIHEKNDLTNDDKRELMSQLVELYLKNRHDIYLYHGYSDQVLQVHSDLSSNRRKGKTGIILIEDFIKPLGFIHTKTMKALSKARFAYLLPDKGDTQLFNEYLNFAGINFRFRETRDNKNPDMMLKIDKDIFILEHKLTNGGGGAQNAEINEIIQFINYEELRPTIHYVSCLQGNYFKKLNSSNAEPKPAQQYRNIMTYLSNYQNNYFVNGHGLKKLITDFTK